MSGYIGEVTALLFLAFALGLDAFSVSLGLGLQRLRLKRIALIGVVLGLFHILMPFLGILFGTMISEQIGSLTNLAGGLLLVGIGAQMFFSAFNQNVKKMIQPVGVGLLLLALGLSIDSFSVGLSLGISGVKTVIALLLFGMVSACLSWIGMLLGRRVEGYLGAYSELLGGSILIAFGLHVLFG
ncbi:manganese efflux pump [Virgibacillus chiguensis]|uniref:Putative manganese efflux pump MntP n=1 Tax=Virgibacillus chiguensis TaxID=411959 RepID=A0A1M5U8S5_9BACI|nr:manganese efflux pump [Virgibacillus chiguensis]SHH59384.1 Putative Mn2+ efflux pump MntP [Virgibacillus chiguensis]